MRALHGRRSIECTHLVLLWHAVTQSREISVVCTLTQSPSPPRSPYAAHLSLAGSGGWVLDCASFISESDSCSDSLMGERVPALTCTHTQQVLSLIHI